VDRGPSVSSPAGRAQPGLGGPLRRRPQLAIDGGRRTGPFPETRLPAISSGSRDGTGHLVGRALVLGGLPRPSGQALTRGGHIARSGGVTEVEHTKTYETETPMGTRTFNSPPFPPRRGPNSAATPTIPTTAHLAVTAQVHADASYRARQGFEPAEAGNLLAVLHGLPPVEGGWTADELERLLFLRHLVQRARIAS
jgi:hypothetical protein